MTLRHQVDLMREVLNKTDINLVTCGHCGSILLHRLDDEIINCYSCKRDMESCDCPDFFYEGMPELDDEL